MTKRRNHPSRRAFLGALGAGASAAALSPLVKTRLALGGSGFNTKHVVIVGIGGGLRTREVLGMAEGATMPNLFGRIPLIPGFGAGDAGNPVIAPEYANARPGLVLPPTLATPLSTQGTVITNLRYAEGAPGHLQGQGCLISGYYNNIENRADARLPVPTIFELHRRATGLDASDCWYISNVGGFYSALQTSNHPAYGPQFAGRFLSPPGTFNALLPIVASGRTDIDLSQPLPVIPDRPEERAAVGRLISVLDGNSPSYEISDSEFLATVEENSAVEKHISEIFADPTYQSFFPNSIGIGMGTPDNFNSTPDGLTIYQAERVLETFQPSVLALTLIDVDVCHGDFNGYLRNQQLADALVSHLWSFIESTPGLAGETTMIVMPEHGRHLFMNGNSPDSLGRSGIDHGQGDDGDRDVWMMVVGPDAAAGQVIAPTGVDQAGGRPTDRYESIDAIMTAMALLGHDEAMAAEISGESGRPGVVIGEVLA